MLTCKLSTSSKQMLKVCNLCRPVAANSAALDHDHCKNNLKNSTFFMYYMHFDYPVCCTIVLLPYDLGVATPDLLYSLLLEASSLTQWPPVLI